MQSRRCSRSKYTLNRYSSANTKQAYDTFQRDTQCQPLSTEKKKNRSISRSRVKTIGRQKTLNKSGKKEKSREKVEKVEHVHKHNDFTQKPEKGRKTSITTQPCNYCLKLDTSISALSSFIKPSDVMKQDSDYCSLNKRRASTNNICFSQNAASKPKKTYQNLNWPKYQTLTYDEINKENNNKLNSEHLYQITSYRESNQNNALQSMQFKPTIMDELFNPLDSQNNTNSNSQLEYHHIKKIEEVNQRVLDRKRRSLVSCRTHYPANSRNDFQESRNSLIQRVKNRICSEKLLENDIFFANNTNHFKSLDTNPQLNTNDFNNSKKFAKNLHDTYPENLNKSSPECAKKPSYSTVGLQVDNSMISNPRIANPSYVLSQGHLTLSPTLLPNEASHHRNMDNENNQMKKAHRITSVSHEHKHPLQQLVPSHQISTQHTGSKNGGNTHFKSRENCNTNITLSLEESLIANTGDGRILDSSTCRHSHDCKFIINNDGNKLKVKDNHIKFIASNQKRQNQTLQPTKGFASELNKHDTDTHTLKSPLHKAPKSNRTLDPSQEPFSVSFSPFDSKYLHSECHQTQTQHNNQLHEQDQLKQKERNQITESMRSSQQPPNKELQELLFKTHNIMQSIEKMDIGLQSASSNCDNSITHIFNPNSNNIIANSTPSHAHHAYNGTANFNIPNIKSNSELNSPPSSDNEQNNSQIHKPNKFSNTFKSFHSSSSISDQKKSFGSNSNSNSNKSNLESESVSNFNYSGVDIMDSKESKEKALPPTTQSNNNCSLFQNAQNDSIPFNNISDFSYLGLHPANKIINLSHLSQMNQLSNATSSNIQSITQSQTLSNFNVHLDKNTNSKEMCSSKKQKINTGNNCAEQRIAKKKNEDELLEANEYNTLKDLNENEINEMGENELLKVISAINNPAHLSGFSSHNLNTEGSLNSVLSENLGDVVAELETQIEEKETHIEVLRKTLSKALKIIKKQQSVLRDTRSSHTSNMTYSLANSSKHLEARLQQLNRNCLLGSSNGVGSNSENTKTVSTQRQRKAEALGNCTKIHANTNTVPPEIMEEGNMNAVHGYNNIDKRKKRVERERERKENRKVVEKDISDFLPLESQDTSITINKLGTFLDDISEQRIIHQGNKLSSHINNLKHTIQNPHLLNSKTHTHI